MPSRSLSSSELTYFLQNLLGGKQVIDSKSFERFWDWYGKCLQVLRYQRHVGALWNSGLLVGFINREDVTNALEGRDPGTFILRFSERHAGQFAVAYVGYEMPRKVKHYLVQPTDTASAKKTLPDFLAECHQFQKVLERKVGPNGANQLEEEPKDDAFGPFYSKMDKIDPGVGYDSLDRKM
jgi:signal transducer and activator of transcription 4